MINIFRIIPEFIDLMLTQREYDYKFCKNVNPLFYPYILSKIYNQHLNLKLNLKNPQNFTDKIQWLKLYDNSELKTMLTDKLAAKEWIRENVPFIKAPKVYTSGKTFKELDLTLCPDHFALKANHGCKMNELVRDKSLFADSDIYNKISSYFNNILKVDYSFVSGFELQYHKIDRKLFCEEWIGFPNTILDYKIHCFHGEPKYIDYMMKDSDNNRTDLIFYDVNWNKVPSFFGNPATESINLERPQNLEIMLEAARVIAKHFKYVRVDLYNLNGEIYFAEATFSPFSGFIQFNSPKYNLQWGEMLNL